MTGLSHGLLSWFVAQTGGDALRDRRLIAWAGVLPDADVVAYAWGTATTGSLDQGFALFADVHHRYTHGIAFVLALAIAGGLAGSRRLRTALLCAATGALHLVADVVASGSEWPIYPFWPVNDVAWSVTWSIPVNDGPEKLLQHLTRS